MIGVEGARAVAAALASCPAITTLKYAAVLRNVDCAADDAHRPAAVRTWLQPFLGSLGINQIGDTGVQALAAALPSWPALATLE